MESEGAGANVFLERIVLVDEGCEPSRGRICISGPALGILYSTYIQEGYSSLLICGVFISLQP